MREGLLGFAQTLVRPVKSVYESLKHQAVTTLLVLYGKHTAYHKPGLHFTLELL